MAAATGTNHRRLGEHRDIRGRVEQVARDIAIGVVPVVLLLVGHGINRPGAYSQTRGGGGEERGSVCGVNEGARGGGGGQVRMEAAIGAREFGIWVFEIY